MSKWEPALVVFGMLLGMLLAMAFAPIVGNAFTRPEPTLSIINRSGDHVSVYIDGRKLGTSTTGRSCFVLPYPMPSPGVLTFKPTGGRPVSTPPGLDLGAFEHWALELHPYALKWDVLGIMPVDVGCVAKKAGGG